MSLAKRLEEQVREGRMTEDEADQLLSDREAIWSGREESGQMLLVFAPLLREAKERT